MVGKPQPFLSRAVSGGARTEDGSTLSALQPGGGLGRGGRVREAFFGSHRTQVRRERGVSMAGDWTPVPERVPRRPRGGPLTFDDKKVCLGTDPLDFGALRQVVAVGVAAGSALVHARVVAREVGDGDGAGRVQVVGGVDFDTVLPCTVPELSIGLIGVVPLKPPLDLGDGVANRLAVQLDAVLSQPLLRQR